MKHRYVSSGELKQSLRSVKALAREDVVHVLEDGHPGYVLCSLDLFEECLAEAAARAAWQVEICETNREGALDESLGRVMNLEEVIEARGMANSQLKITRSAATDFVREQTHIDMAVLLHMLDRIAAEPHYGITIEMQGVEGARKVSVPPYDVLYHTKPDSGEVIVVGIVRAIEARLTNHA